MALSDEDKEWMKAQLEANQVWMMAQLTRVESRMMAQLEQLEVRMMAKVEHVETKLLTEFHKWASPIENRLRTHAAALRAVDIEMEALQDKVKSLEQR